MNQLVLVYTLLKEVSYLITMHIPSTNLLLSHCTAAPVIDTPSSSTITVSIGSSVALSCTSRGSPPDTFTWRKDNDPTVLQSTKITAVDYTNTNAVFRADYSTDSVNTSDSGTYTCTVTNPIGSYSTAITAFISGELHADILIWIYSTNACTILKVLGMRSIELKLRVMRQMLE